MIRSISFAAVKRVLFGDHSTNHVHGDTSCTLLTRQLNGGVEVAVTWSAWTIIIIHQQRKKKKIKWTSGSYYVWRSAAAAAATDFFSWRMPTSSHIHRELTARWRVVWKGICQKSREFSQVPSDDILRGNSVPIIALLQGATPSYQLAC